MIHDRAAGLLLHPTSLPGSWGSGDFGFEVENFLDWAAEAGFRWWQILPITPPAGGCSPYTSLSAFAMNPLLISVDRLVHDGLLSRDEVDGHTLPCTSACDWQGAERIRMPLLRRAFEAFRNADRLGELKTFRDPVQKPWLDDWCLFAALRREVSDSGWWTWESGLMRRDPDTLVQARDQYRQAVDFECFLQLTAHRHWSAVRQAARDRGIHILGDLPIYVAYDSADLWAHPELFELDDDLKPTKVAGVPPDYFSEDGQLWGNPLYRWVLMAERGFRWWIDRLRANLDVADMVRLDHFRAFADYWEVDAGADNARDGQWRLGPDKAFFDALGELGDPLPLVAEDLGDLSDAVHTLRHATGLPCMKVLHFGFDPDSDHAPHRLSENTLLYTGTHDNNTTLGWYHDLADDIRHRLHDYTGGGEHDVVFDLIRLAYTSVARWAIIPMQDALGLGSEARMNVPGVAEGNWGWRMTSTPGPETAARLRRLAEISGRLAE